MYSVLFGSVRARVRFHLWYLCFLFFPETANSDTSCYFDFCFLQALEKANSPSLRIVLVGSLTGSDRSLAVLGLVLMEGLVRVFLFEETIQNFHQSCSSTCWHRLCPFFVDMSKMLASHLAPPALSKQPARLALIGVPPPWRVRAGKGKRGQPQGTLSRGSSFT